MKTKLHPVFEEMAKKWPSSVVERMNVGELTGGLIGGKRLACLDSLGEGPSVRLKMGSRRVGYPVTDFLRWLQDRTDIVKAA